MVEREVIRERPAEREIIVDERPVRGGGGVVAAILGVVLVLLIGWFLLNALGIMDEAADNATDGGGAEVQVDVPAEGGE